MSLADWFRSPAYERPIDPRESSAKEIRGIDPQLVRRLLPENSDPTVQEVMVGIREKNPAGFGQQSRAELSVAVCEFWEAHWDQLVASHTKVLGSVSPPGSRWAGLFMILVAGIVLVFVSIALAKDGGVSTAASYFIPPLFAAVLSLAFYSLAPLDSLSRLRINLGVFKLTNRSAGTAGLFFAVWLAAHITIPTTQPIAVPFRLKLGNTNSVDLERDGSPTRLAIRVDGIERDLSPARNGTGIVVLPPNTNHFVITSALWRGYDLKSQLRTPLEISDEGIVIEFADSRSYATRLDSAEIKRLAIDFLGVKSEKELLQVLGLAAIPQSRDRTVEFQNCRVQVRNESGESIIPTLFDCDEFVADAGRPFNIVHANVGTQLISPRSTSELNNPFSTMSAYNHVFAVLISWQARSGTRSWYRLAGFIRLQPESNEEDRIYGFTVDGDAENVFVRTEQRESRTLVVR